MAGFDPGYIKRDYLLPPGCKDLIDVLNLEKGLKQVEAGSGAVPQPLEPRPKSPLAGMTVELPPSVIVKEIALLLGIKPFRVVAELMILGVFASVHERVDFDVAAKVLAKYGVQARKLS